MATAEAASSSSSSARKRRADHRSQRGREGLRVLEGPVRLFSDEELKQLEEKSTQQIDITEFVKSDLIDPIYFSKPYYLGPDKGGSRAYTLLARALEETGRWAVAKYAARGKGYLVVIRPLGKGLVMQQLYYPNEIRAIDEIDSATRGQRQRAEDGHPARRDERER
jgi:Ku protein